MDRELIRNVRLLSICRFMLYAQFADENWSPKYYTYATAKAMYMHFLMRAYRDKHLYSATTAQALWIFNAFSVNQPGIFHYSTYFVPLSRAISFILVK